MGLSDYLPTTKGPLIRTIVIYLSFFCYSIALIVPGVSLLDLEIRIQEPFAVTSRLISVHLIGYIVGSVLVGFIEKYTNPYLTLSVSSILAGLLTVIVPWFYDYNCMVALFFIIGIAHSIYELECNICLFEIWGENVCNYIQLLQVSFGTGAFIAPLIVQPFMLPIPEDIGEDWDLYRTAYKPDDTTIQWPFMFAGMTCVITGLAFLSFISHGKRRGNPEISVEDTAAKTKASNLKIYMAVIWVCIISHTSFSIETIFHSFGQAYGVKSDLKMEKKRAALLPTVFWAGFSAARLMFVGGSKFINQKLMVHTCIGCLLVSNFLYLTYAMSNEICMFLCSFLTGFGSSPLFSEAFASLEKYFHLSGPQASIIFTFGTIGCALHAPIVGYFMDDNPNIYIYYVVSLSSLLVVFKLCLPIICNKLFGKKIAKNLQSKMIDSYSISSRRSSIAAFHSEKLPS